MISELFVTSAELKRMLRGPGLISFVCVRGISLVHAV